MTQILTKLKSLISPPQTLTDKEFLEKEISRWKVSPQRMAQIKAFMYFNGDHDILKRKRTVIGEKGEREEITNLPNNKTVYNLYGKLVIQKTNYLLGKPFVLQGENREYINALKEIFDKDFMRILKNAGKAALNGGIAWLYVYFENENKLCFRLFPAYEILPFWKDNDHTEAEAVLRLYQVEEYDGKNPTLTEKAELYTLNGVQRFILKNGKLLPDTDVKKTTCRFLFDINRYNDKACRFPCDTNSCNDKARRFPCDTNSRNDKDCRFLCDTNSRNNNAFCFPYTVDPQSRNAYTWKKLPLIPIKSNDAEIPLLKKVKSLQDGLNLMLSDFENNMQEDARNTILVLKNYDGTNLGEFRKNLAAYGAVKVRSDRDAQGGVETLEVQVNPDNYKAIIALLKEGIIENAMGFRRSESESGYNSPNQLNIKSMYTDIDLDANDMETELQAAFTRLLPFVNTRLYTNGKGDFRNERAEIIFNRDMLINETEAITNCINSMNLLSKETAVAQHPWVTDTEAELKRIRSEAAQKKGQKK